MTSRQKGLFLALLGSVLWGGSGVAAQYLLEDCGMTTEYLVVIRMFLAGIMLLLMSVAQGHSPSLLAIWQTALSRKKLLYFSFFGMLGVQYTYFQAIAYSNAPTGTILQYMMPIVILLWYGCTKKILPSLSEALTTVMAVAGCWLLVSHGNLTSLAINEWALFWGILSAFAAAYYTIFPRELLMDWPSTTVIGWAMLTGGLMMSLVFPPLAYPGVFHWQAFAALFYLIVFGTAAAFWAYVTSTKYILPQEAGILNATEPLTSIVFSVILLGVVFQLPEILGSILIVIPVLLVSRHKSSQD